MACKGDLPAVTSITLQALYTLDFSGKVRPAWRNIRICLKSEIG